MFSVKQETKKYLSLVVTHECNKKCPFCIDKYRGSGEFMTLKTVNKVLNFAERKGIEDILIIGGEPTLHPEIVKISRMVYSGGFRSILTTNYTKPDVVFELDGLIDCFNISYYNQKSLPSQKTSQSDITLHTLIHKKQLDTKEKLDRFIKKHEDHGHLKFSTLTNCNDWTERNSEIDYLDDLDCEWVVLFNEMLGQVYRDSVIKRYDRVFRDNAHQSFKAHVDGEISTTWDRTL